MKNQIKKLTLTLGLLTSMMIMIVVLSNRESFNISISAKLHVSKVFNHYVVENGTQWIMQSASTLYKLTNNRL